uniref:Uncharacterized protein n=1 Tax=viral metagenome TaxID=1070528 RepID=A0A6M3LFU1_9ZZZZ
MNIEDVIKRLQELRKEYGNLPVYFLYDAFINVPITSIKHGKKTKSYNREPDLIPERVVCLCPADEDDFGDGTLWIDD